MLYTMLTTSKFVHARHKNVILSQTIKDIKYGQLRKDIHSLYDTK